MSNAPRELSAQRDWGTDEQGLSVMHVDMDAFYASVEIADQPELHGRPVVVAGGERSVVLAASYEARKLGVRSAMPTVRARILAPHAVFVPPRHERYSQVSRAVMAMLHDASPVVEQVSIDEAFVDVSGVPGGPGARSVLAKKIRAQVEHDHAVTCSIGIARNKFVAKLASTQAKPNGLLVIPDQRTIDFLHVLPVGALWGVGEKTESRLRDWGITRVEEVARMDVAHLARIVGNAAATQLHRLAHGVDDRTVTPGREEKSVGAEHTFTCDVSDPQALKDHMRSLADRVASRLRSLGVVGYVVSIKVRDADFRTTTRSRTLDSPTDSTAVLFHEAWALMGRNLTPGQRVRLVGIRVERITQRRDVAFQETFDDVLDGSADVNRRSDGAVDEIRRRFGVNAISIGVQSGLQLPKT